MAELKDVLYYILSNYPDKSDLCNARVVKMAYLADWRNVIVNEQQVTDINWYFDNHGPFVWDIKECAEANPDLFSILETTNMYGNKKLLFRLNDNGYKWQLNENEQAAIDKAIQVSKDKSWNEFIRMVYSTYPIATSNKYTRLNLGEKLKNFKEEKKASN